MYFWHICKYITVVPDLFLFVLFLLNLFRLMLKDLNIRLDWIQLLEGNVSFETPCNYLGLFYNFVSL